MKEIPGDTLRIIDANLNRIGEGLRFMEEIARLSLNDSVLTQKLKNMRHEMVRVDWQLQQQLIQARDSEGDVGADMEVPGEAKQREIPSAIVANSRRVQESLRVMEEITKAPVAGLDPEKFKKARFDLYTMEKTLLSRILRQDKIKHLSGLYVIVDTAALKGRSHVEVAGQSIKGGAKIIQLRDKTSRKKELIAIAQKLRDLCARHNVLFIMNDAIDVAIAAGADGLHVGQDDLPAGIARRLLPIDSILGCSVSTVAEADAARSEGADYIAVGAMYPTSSKEAAGVVGPERLREIHSMIKLPLVAIGGINMNNVREVLAAGADSVAVISAVMDAKNVAEATRHLVNVIEGEHGE